MKKTFLILTVSATISAFGQTTPPGSAQPAAFSQAGQGLPASPAFPGLPGFGGPGLTNAVNTNSFPSGLAQALANVQNDILQALPWLTSFNNNVEFTSSGAGQLQNPAIGVPSGNLGTRLGGNSSANLSQNLAQNVASPTGPSPANAANNPSPAGIAPPSPTGVSNSWGLPPGFGPDGTNNLGGIVTARDALLILQSDMERMLPILNAINGSAGFGFGVPIISEPGTSPTALLHPLRRGWSAHPAADQSLFP